MVQKKWKQIITQFSKVWHTGFLPLHQRRFAYRSFRICEALEFVKQNVTIKAEDRETIFHARKSILYNEGEPLKNKIIKNKPIVSTL